MTGIARRTLTGLALLLMAFTSAPASAESTGQQRVVERARLVLEAFLDDPNFEQMRVYVQNAYGVLIVPDMLKAGFFFGGEHGVGVLLVRDPQTGSWGQPGFYDLYGGSFGLQFGGQSSDVVFTLMNRGAVEQLVESPVKMKFEADAGMAVGRLGASVGAGTTTNLGEDLYVFAKSKGLFGGVSLDSTVIVPKHDWNRAYYGRPVDLAELLRSRQQVASNDINALHQSLTRF
ncbi:MAG: lipid-binding SYLF domain-containing protein [Geminicoccaceae bacterium]|nr:lipid-binding SYLF domain-containing protein [Geminicoccaceae bacterium]